MTLSACWWRVLQSETPMKLVVALVLLSLAGQALSLGECELFQRSQHSIAGRLPVGARV